MKYYIGIDLGTSSVKLMLVDEEGEIKNTVTKEYPVFYPRSGWSEQNAEDWWKAVCEAIPELLDGVDGRSVKGIGVAGQLHDGAVTLWCTLDDNTPREYSAEISAINRAAEGNKCFTVHITDKALLEKTGGIIQGMSGSPIIQDGRLVGAVTHVLIGDPTTGYGIFIENMLNAAQMPMAQAS